MANLGGWIHNFTVTETQTHKGGYTIYKITSIVFPRSLPQALTCLTIWKRFHDVKRLHRELSRRNKDIAYRLPEPTDCSYFKRFDKDVIQRRKEYILQLLDFIAQHPDLYKCHAFAQFFSNGSRTPNSSTVSSPPKHKLSGLSFDDKENECSHLELRYDFHSNGLALPNLDRDKIRPLSVENGKGDAINAEDEIRDASAKKEGPANTVEQNEHSEEMVKKSYSFLTPMVSLDSDDCDYIYEAALEFSRAVQAEANVEYNEAYLRYNRGIEVLINGSKDDSSEERTAIATAKIEKYKARADGIYRKYLTANHGSSTVNPRLNFQLSIDVSNNMDSAPKPMPLEQPVSNLGNYKVTRVLADRVMQVQCRETSLQMTTFVLKGIEKPPSSSSTQSIFLPQHVPYMVELLAFFQTQHKIFLLLRHAEGGRLYDYIQSYTPTIDKVASITSLFPEPVDALPIDSNEIRIQDSDNMVEAECVSAVTPPETVNSDDAVSSSQELIESLSKTLKRAHEIRVQNARSHGHLTNSTKIPEASLKQWARELAVAINSLHDKGVILGDLHMENLLLGSRGQLLLSYFCQNEGLMSEHHQYRAYDPEALAGHFVAPERPLTFRSDWWSYGVVLYQLLLNMPFKAAHPGHIALYSCVQYPEKVELSDDARDLLDNLLQQLPGDRLNFSRIKQHSFFEGTNWLDVEQNGLNASPHSLPPPPPPLRPFALQ